MRNTEYVDSWLLSTSNGLSPIQNLITTPGITVVYISAQDTTIKTLLLLFKCGFGLEWGPLSREDNWVATWLRSSGSN